MNPFTDEELRRIALDAAWLQERLESAPTIEAPGAVAERRWASWRQAAAANDEPFFLRRLSWDAFSVSRALSALSDSDAISSALGFGGPPEFPHESQPMGWTHWLNPLLDEAERAYADLRVNNHPASDRLSSSVPFPEFLEPFVRLARLRFQERVAVDALSTSFADDLEAGLYAELSRHASLHVLERFENFKAERPGGRLAQEKGRQHYDEFLADFLTKGLRALCLDDPVLVRLLLLIIQRWARASGEMVNRIVSDQEILNATFGSGQSIGLPIRVNAGLSDSHDGGRRVSEVAFSSGLTLIYKPHSLLTERFYNELLGWCRGRGLECAPPAIQVLDRGHYGWVEKAERGSLTSSADIDRYFTRAGALIAFAHVLGGRDLHMENVIATNSGPVLVDVEMLFQPSESAADVTPNGEEGRAAFPQSCLSTGLVHWIQTGANDEVIDVGGLFGTGAALSGISERVWRDLGTDTVSCEDREVRSATPRNRIFCEGVPYAPSDKPEQVLEGFRSCLRFLSESHGALLAPKGPLAKLEELRTRILVRPTRQYAFLLNQLRSPSFHKSGIKFSLAMETMHRVFQQSEQRPVLWPLVRRELAMLHQLDVPRFEIGVDEVDIDPRKASQATGPNDLGGDQVVSGYYAETGADLCRQRLAGLNDDEIVRQSRVLEACLSEHLGAKLKFEPPKKPLDDGSSQFLRDGADWIARGIEVRFNQDGEGIAAYGGGGIAEDCLYSGISGVGLFLAAQYTSTRNANWLELLDRVLAPLGRRIQKEGARLHEDEPLGVASGAGSLVYALSWIGKLSNEPEYLDWACVLGEGLSLARAKSDIWFDLVAGSAGAAVALDSLYRVTGDDTWLSRATSIGEGLLQAAERHPDGALSWRNPQGLRYGGFAHGSSGIALALTRLFESSKRDEFLEAAQSAHAFERHLFSPKLCNWPVPVPGDSGLGGSRVMTAWCHGAPGIALERSLVADLFLDESEKRRVSEELTIALNTTAAMGLAAVDHLCCGSLGRAEVLLTAGKRLGQSVLIDAAGQLAASVLERASADGRFRLSGSGFEFRVFDPGFFRGLSGIGYQLLRMQDPDSLPSILAFEALPHRKVPDGLVEKGAQ